MSVYLLFPTSSFVSGFFSYFFILVIPPSPSHPPYVLVPLSIPIFLSFLTPHLCVSFSILSLLVPLLHVPSHPPVFLCLSLSLSLHLSFRLSRPPSQWL